MPTDAFDTIAKLINSPPGQLAAGAVLAGIVWKFFEQVEAVLTNDTKLEIAVWLLDRKPLTPRLQSWPDTFTKVFNRVFGPRHFSLYCLTRSVAVTCLIPVLWAPIYALQGTVGYFATEEIFRYARQLVFLLFAISLCTNALPDYFSLGETRIVLHFMRKTNRTFVLTLLLCVDCVATLFSAFITFVVWLFVSRYFAEEFGMFHPIKSGVISNWFDFRSFDTIQIDLYGNDVLFLLMFVVPSMFTSIWLWLYAGSGFLLKAARRFDIGFDWFNRRFDIEKKPLQCIGLVAGAIVAVVYWAVVVVHRFVS